jgi:hypothetical protein
VPRLSTALLRVRAQDTPDQVRCQGTRSVIKRLTVTVRVKLLCGRQRPASHPSAVALHHSPMVCTLVSGAVHEGKIRKSRGALFVAIVKRACADRGIPLSLGQPQYASRS